MTNTAVFLAIVIVVVLIISIPLMFYRIPQTTNTILMVKPDDFGYNAESAKTNSFSTPDIARQSIAHDALQEFTDMVTVLHGNGVRVITMPSPPGVHTPDAVFPNNWFSILKSASGEVTLIIYPMHNPSRAHERQVDELQLYLKANEIGIDKTLDLSFFEDENKALEGTGSLVFDHPSRTAFISLSERSNEEVAHFLLRQIDYSPIFFHSYDGPMPIYHTNVMLSIGTDFAVLCADCIYNTYERNHVIKKLKSLGKELIYITPTQMKSMCANILEVRGGGLTPYIVMSKRAHRAFTEAQLTKFKAHAHLIVVNLDVIEQVGGGSVRCMMAEIFH